METDLIACGQARLDIILIAHPHHLHLMRPSCSLLERQIDLVVIRIERRDKRWLFSPTSRGLPNLVLAHMSGSFVFSKTLLNVMTALFNAFIV